LANSRQGFVVAGVCAAGVLGLFVLEMVTQRDRVLTAIALPLVAAAWSLAGWRLLSVAILALSVELAAGWAEKIHPEATLVETLSLMTLTAGIHLLSRAQSLRARRRPRKSSILGDQAPAGTWDDLRLLTTRESAVVTLAAQGHTNREIGKRLFIGERTVETHLSNAYSKLGLRSKVELVRRFSEMQERAAEIQTIDHNRPKS
jgi:DNA-binding CsgD family transcriptional regulator